ncbi:transposase [Fulvimarina sp. MAC8]|uniref:transposase n=1 Tax=Fulvimarina sp. MAC8 TaxID=3162874 RepID=UPI0032ECD7AB
MSETVNENRPVTVFPSNARIGQQGTLTRIRAERGSRRRAPRGTRYEWDYIFGAVCPGRAKTAALHVPDNITILTLPPYAPELNPVENIWAYLRSNKLAISVFDSYDDIVDCCCEAWNFFANDPDRIPSIADRQYAKAVIG